MSNNGYDYDTAAIRREAQKIRRCADMLASSALPRLDRAGSRLDGNFMGRTADALEKTLGDSRRQLRTLQDDLACVSGALDRFANALEEADRRLADLMDG